MSLKMSSEDIEIEIIMLPVSAGDATLIVWSDGLISHAVLIDRGLQKNDAVSYLQSIGIFHLDLIILSHPDLDHIGGLLAIMKSQAMSVDRIWCFDLNFLREFVRTGKIPPPRQATREVVYAYALRSTLDQFSDILKMANGKGVQVLQVSEGYKLCLGGILFEVLYPPQSFYNSLHNPIALKRMLNRKLPDDWKEDSVETEEENARKLCSKENQERLTEMIDTPQMPQEGVHISDLQGEIEEQSSEEESEQLPWRMVGTLYNNLSIVVKATFLGGINAPSILLPGDLSDWTTLVLRQWHNLKADILKIPHHGSKHIEFDYRYFRDILDDYYPFPFYYWFEKRFPYPHPFHFPFWGNLSRTEFRRFFESLYRGFRDKPLSLINDLVNPSHVLVFPHPQHHLPSVPLDKFSFNLISNRHNRNASALSLKDNTPSPAHILVGLERLDIKEK